MFRELTPIKSFEELSAQSDAILIDCRTPAEWNLIGLPDLSGIGKKVVTLAVADDAGRPNPDFVGSVEAIASKNTPIHVICRVGGRSANACRMLSEAGFTALVNVSEGFEGRQDENGHRSSVEGWKFHKLPWNQS